MTSKEIRQQFLEFFKQRGHTIVPSASVIPYDDPTLLFTNAGMNQFKDVFLGTGKRDYVRSADSQKCIRVSGKHNDLEEVGRDTYHHTFFEMLGNWSFGDYYKKEAIEWAWELLTQVWGLDKKRLHATVFETDDEAEQLWKSVTDIEHSHIHRCGKKDNFWEMGETGPCGPCSEIHVDLTEDLSGGHLVNAGDPRVMEIWNLVFIQYNRDSSGNLTPLPAKHVDTGMGFERICAVLQKKKSNYDTDVFSPIIARIAELTGKPYSGEQGAVSSDSQNSHQTEIDIAMRVIADHVRMLSFSIADGGIPSNEGRGYVMRRILRRAARFGRNLGMREPFIYKVVQAVVDSMGEQYPEIKEKQSHIERVIKGEEESFNVTLDRGIELHSAEVQRCKSAGENIFSGEVAFKLHDTFGFPIDMTEMMARENMLEVDSAKFEELMEEQKERGRASKHKTASLMGHGTTTQPIRFSGYVKDELITRVAGFARDVDAKFIGVFLDETPFYAESGGQVGDTGIIEISNVPVEPFQIRSQDVSTRTYLVTDTFKDIGQYIHKIQTPDLFIQGYDNRIIHLEVKVKIDSDRRRNIEKNHTATHIFHEALRQVIGEHSHQQGSLVAPDYLRFDFNHFEKLTADQIKAIEEIVNEKIAENITVNALNDPKDWLSIEEAKRRYPKLKMFFGEKYGDTVRVVEIDPKFSVELCGGTHVKNTREIGLFKIISEGSVASGVRRVEAVTGDGLKQHIQKQIEKVGQMDEQISKLIEEKEELEKQLGNARVETASRPTLGTVSLSTESPTAKDIELVEHAIKVREHTIEQVTKSTHDLKKELSKQRVKEASSNIDALVSGGSEVAGFKVVAAKIEVSTADELKNIGDTLRSKLGSGVGVLASVIDEKVSLVCVVTDDLIKEKKLQAGKIVGEIAKKLGGGGGGRPHLATAGGKDVGKLDEVLKDVANFIHHG
ncbi:MAG: alanine--tRNA ligase [Ignavibacteriae bacterium]|nr:alanine--tRNA ligase [Ignavibacteriota bacterium]